MTRIEHHAPSSKLGGAMSEPIVELSDLTKRICAEHYRKKCAGCPIQAECFAPVSVLTFHTLAAHTTRINEASEKSQAGK